MLPYRDSRLTRFGLIIFFIVLIAYAYFEARGLLFGPSISIDDTSVQTVQSQYILITGHADRIASLSVDGEPIQVTINGDFQEPYVLSPGENQIVFDAKDSYGRTREQVLTVVYTQSATDTASTSSIQTASSTSTGATTTMSTSSLP